MPKNNKEKPELFSKDFQKQWSPTHKYKHIHTGEYCTFESYVAEYLIIRREEAFSKSKPEYKFWTKGSKLYPAFVRQVKALHKLRKTYSEEIILGAIKSKHFEKIFYVGLYAKNYVGWTMNKVALEAIECYHKERQEQEKLKAQAELVKHVEVVEEKKDINRRINTPAGKKSILNNLRKL